MITSSTENWLLIFSFMPHGMCYRWDPKLVGLHLVSNAIIALAYFSIPVTLIYILRKRSDIPFNGIFLLFAAFIVFCGAGHAFDIWTLWHPNYWISLIIRTATAIISLLTAIALIESIPQILALPSPEQITLINRQLEREIEERKQTEKELIKEKQFLQALLDNLSDGIVACDREGILTLFNRATQELHGIPQAAIPASEWVSYYDLYLADGKTPMKMAEIPLLRALSGESVKNVEMQIVPKQREAKILLANGDPIIAPDGEKLGAVVAMRDISELKKIEQALRESETRFLETFNCAAVGIATVAINGSWLEVNPTLCQMLGYSKTELQATNFQAITYAEDLEDDLAKVEQLLSGEIRAYQMEKRYIHKQNYLLWVNLSVSLVKNQDDLPLYFVVLVENIDRRKQAEQALASLNRRLEDKVAERTQQLEQVNTLLLSTNLQLEKRNQELDRFAYVASHDLKAPLRAIANLSTWIEEDLEEKLDDETRYNMNLLRGRVQRLENLIDGLLAYSRVGRIAAKLEKVEVDRLLLEIINSLAVPPEFTIEIVGEMPILFTERMPLDRVFSNLIHNAIEHHPHDRGKVKISAFELEEWYQFTVSDDGLGIDSKYHQKIFTMLILKSSF